MSDQRTGVRGNAIDPFSFLVAIVILGALAVGLFSEACNDSKAKRAAQTQCAEACRADVESPCLGEALAMAWLRVHGGGDV